jgi:hypothetical protein
MMKLQSKLVTAVVLPLAIIGSGLAQANTLPDEQFVVGNPPTNERYTGINLADADFAVGSLSSLEAMTGNGTSPNATITSRTPCQKIGSAGCEADKYFQYNALLGFCDSTLTTDCVTKVFAKDQSGKEVVGKFVENYPGTTEYTYLGDSSIGLPTGASSFIVDFPDLAHQGGTQYLVVAYLQGSRSFNQTQFRIENFNSAIFAVSKVSGNFSIPKPEPKLRPDITLNGRSTSAGGFNQNQSVSRRSACIKTAPGGCLIAWTLPMDITFGYSLKLHEKIKGWLHGRLSDAQATITSASDGDQLLSIEGKPTLIPAVYAWFKKSDYPAPLGKFYSSQDAKLVNANGLGWPSNDGRTIDGPDGLPYSTLKEGFGYEEGSFKEVLAWIDSIGDKASYARSAWSIRSMESQQYEKCMKGSDTLSGIVTTNSTMYIGNPPTFNRADQTLDYKVVSPHYLPDGSEFKGSYDLAIKGDVARCIYGFSSAPISATISIISSDGTSQVATTLVREKGEWLFLSAKNFTFSSPTVKVKLKQASKKPLAKTVTITCIKGKAIKKVTGSKPVCPAGYGKK